MKTLNLGLLGFGNVLRAFVQLLLDKSALIQQRYEIDIRLTGIATRSRGIAIHPEGLALAETLTIDNLSKLSAVSVPRIEDFIRFCPADVILEATWVNPQNGQPATDYCRLALETGKSVVTANKGPVAFAHRELTALAKAKGLKFFYESTVLDGAPLHSLGREGLLVAEVSRIRGILNSTTNSILSRMGTGVDFEVALQEMQTAGTAEADPSNDLEGWDAAIKIVVLANTLMGADLRPADVDRTGIGGISKGDVQAAQAQGQKLKLLCEAFWDEQHHVHARVQPQALPPDDPLAWLEGASSGVTIETDTLGRLSLVKSPSSPRSTAYGMLVDTLNIARGDKH